jgi:hypothetical protein
MKHYLQLILVFLSTTFLACDKSEAQAPVYPVPAGKQIYIPEELLKTNFNCDTSNWSYARMAYSDNVVVFWEPGFGTDPAKASPKEMQFDVKDLLNKAENIYAYYRDTLKFIDQSSNLAKYRLMVWVKYQTEWLACGAGYDNKVGALWVSPSTMHPVGGVIAHELGHSFQYQVFCDGKFGFRDLDYVGQFWEQSAQFMAFQLYPQETLHNMKFFVDNSYRNFSNEEIRYESFYFQEYWKMKHGKDFIGKLWTGAEKPDHPLQAYMRVAKLTQEQLNDEICDYAMHNITWDYPLGNYIRTAAINQQAKHKTNLTTTDNITYEVAAANAPECYGYNAFQLQLPTTGTEVRVNFKGLDNSFSDLSGWRYAFVGVKADGKTAIYGTQGKTKEGELTFKITDEVKVLWLVVSGAPQKHWNHSWGVAAASIPKFPYQVKFTNTKPI